MFSKEKKSKQSSLVQIINALQKENIGYHDYLEEIKMDLEENIPLSQKKVEYLKEGIARLKEIKKTKIPEQGNQTKTVKKQNKTKPWFKNILSKKKTSGDKKLQEKTSKNKPDKNTSDFAVDKDPDAQKQSNTEKKVFFKFFNKKNTATNEMNTSKELQEHDDALPENKTDNKKTFKDDFHDPESKSDDLPSTTETELDKYSNHANNTELEMETILLREKQESKFEQTKRLELDEIKYVLEELKKEKNLLKSDVEEIKSRFSVKMLLKKYEDIEQKLQSTTNSLYSIQSDVYDRIKEIRMLRKDLGIIKDDLESI